MALQARREAEGYLREHGFILPVLADEAGTLANQYGINRLPAIVLLSSARAVISVSQGNQASLEDLEKLLQKAGAPGSRGPG